MAITDLNAASVMHGIGAYQSKSITEESSTMNGIYVATGTLQGLRPEPEKPRPTPPDQRPPKPVKEPERQPPEIDDPRREPSGKIAGG
jgi:hypothetical protein